MLSFFLNSGDLKLVNCHIFNVNIQLEPISRLIVFYFRRPRYFEETNKYNTNLMSKFVQTGGVADLLTGLRHRIIPKCQDGVIQRIHRANCFRSESITAKRINEIHNHPISTFIFSSTLTGAALL